MNEAIEKNESKEKVSIQKVPSKENSFGENRLILARWQGHEDDGSSGCYNYNFKI